MLDIIEMKKDILLTVSFLNKMNEKRDDVTRMRNIKYY